MKTTGEKIAIMAAAAAAEYKGLETSIQGGIWKPWKNAGDEPVWNWAICDYRVVQQQKEHTFAMHAHLLVSTSGVAQIIVRDDRCTSGWVGNIMAIKPITITIREGEGIDAK